MSSLRDGLGYEMVMQSGLAGPASNHAYFVGSVTSESAIKGTTISGTTFAGTSFTSALGQLGPAGTGSPSTWGLGFQAGSAIASNAAVTVTFGTAFRAVPVVIVTPAGSSTVAGDASGTSTTAFGLLGTSGLMHNWIAIGSL